MSEPENRPLEPPVDASNPGQAPASQPARTLTPEARRALAEAQERRKAAEDGAGAGRRRRSTAAAGLTLSVTATGRSRA